MVLVGKSVRMVQSLITTLYNQAKTFSESIAKGSVKAKHGEDKPKESSYSIIL